MYELIKKITHTVFKYSNLYFNNTFLHIIDFLIYKKLYHYSINYSLTNILK